MDTAASELDLGAMEEGGLEVLPYMLIQDNTPCHKAKMVQEWFKEHNKQSVALTWVLDSPDLNPVEYLWDVLANKSDPWLHLTAYKI